MKLPKKAVPGVFALGVLLGLAEISSAGEVSGHITFSGAPPERPQYERSSAPACPKAAPADDPLQLSAANGVANAVVRILGASSASSSPGAETPPPVIVEQKGCSYVPRVQAAQRGQAVRVVNGDALLHNVHAFEGRHGLFNLAQPPGSPPVERSLKDPDVLRLKCDIHPWMFGWVIYSDNPFFAVTGRDGRFVIPRVPPGKYRLAVWHELLGTREIELTVGEKPRAVDVDLATK